MHDGTPGPSAVSYPSVPFGDHRSTPYGPSSVTPPPPVAPPLVAVPPSRSSPPPRRSALSSIHDGMLRLVGVWYAIGGICTVAAALSEQGSPGIVVLFGIALALYGTAVALRLVRTVILHPLALLTPLLGIALAFGSGGS